MKYFAKLNQNNIVEEVVTSETIPSGNYVETYFDKDGKNYASVGFTYDRVKDNFISLKPFPSWSLDENLVWQPPVKLVEDGRLTFWNEEKQIWEEKNII